MDFVVGDGNIAIATTQTPIIFYVLYCKHQTIDAISLSNFLHLLETSDSGR